MKCRMAYSGKLGEHQGWGEWQWGTICRAQLERRRGPSFNKTCWKNEQSSHQSTPAVPGVPAVRAQEVGHTSRLADRLAISFVPFALMCAALEQRTRCGWGPKGPEGVWG